MRRLAVVLAALPCLVHAQSETNKPEWSFRIGPSFGQPIVGSEDTRRGTFYSLGYSRPEPRITLRGLKGDMLVEGYYLFTKGGGFEDIPVNQMHSYGVMVTAKYWTRWIRGLKTHADLSFGLVHNSITTRDLDSNWNTTPGFGVGIDFGRFDFTVHWYHASNGGTDGNNQGTNQIQYLLSVKF